ncbi:MAG TPA: hypothetical protein PLJ21_12515 [Pseudobdellovibrionaceae bacterium]|nr:hypothetical protein [Pseudobdellovibrionaceae bacterium]
MGARLLKRSSYAFLFLFLSACQNEVGFGVLPQSEKFNQKISYNNKVDFLWIIDNSSSMTDKQIKLSNQLPATIDALNALKLDYHMAFITTDVRDKTFPSDTEGSGGKFIGEPKFLTQDSSNFLSEVQARIVQGSLGSNLERGLLSLERVFADSYLSNEGQGFFREDALLVINVLSDEDDKSNKTADYYLNFLNQIKPLGAGQPGGWLLNFIGVLDINGTCASNGYPDPGYIYMDLASWSGGRSDNICSDSLVGAVSGIRERIEQILTDYPLESAPDLTTLRVYINDGLVPQSSVNGWTYESSLNVIRFYGTYVPAADSDIRVDYTPNGAR